VRFTIDFHSVLRLREIPERGCQFINQSEECRKRAWKKELRFGNWIWSNLHFVYVNTISLH